MSSTEDELKDHLVEVRNWLRSAARQEFKARQGRSGISMESLADMLEAQADAQDALEKQANEQAAKDDTSK
jgi:hypothetical protein